ncbi:MAG TPA: ANTAR domain-containing protein, partial [Methylophilus sp.]
IWFERCSQRLADIWQIQCALIADMHQSLNQLVHDAKQDLQDTRQHLQQLQRKPQAGASRDSAFFNLSIPVERAYAFFGEATTQPYPMESIITLLQQQSQQIAEIETELSETKKALAERKVIERAKGMLMTSLGLNEVEAYKVMRSTAMEQNRKLVDVAENILLQRQPRAH